VARGARLRRGTGRAWHPSEETHWCRQFALPPDAGHRVWLCRTLWHHLDEAGERLLLITGWGVWPSGEHRPLFESLRAAAGEHRPLIDVPGHLFTAQETDAGLSYLIVCAYFLWDCWLLDTRGSGVMLSHDEYGVAFAPNDRDATFLETQFRDDSST
jgi:hypothetical protein